MSKIQRIERIDEIFKAVDGYDNYEVSNLGKIRSITRKDSNGRNVKGKIMKQRLNKKEGFLFLDLIDNKGKRRTVYPHKQVAKAFCINVMEGIRKVVVHLDGDLTNNNSNNLDWATHSEALKLQFKQGKKNNFKMWEERKRRYPNGYKNSLVERKHFTSEELEQKNQPSKEPGMWP